MPRSSLAKKHKLPEKKKPVHERASPVRAHKKAKATQSKKQPGSPPPPNPPKTPEPVGGGIWFNADERYRQYKLDGNLVQQAIEQGWKVPQRAKEDLPGMIQGVLEKLVESRDPFAIPALAKLASVELAMEQDNRDEIRLALAIKKDLRDEKELEFKLKGGETPTVNVNIALKELIEGLPLEGQRLFLEEIRRRKALSAPKPVEAV